MIRLRFILAIAATPIILAVILNMKPERPPPPPEPPPAGDQPVGVYKADGDGLTFTLRHETTDACDHMFVVSRYHPEDWWYNATVVHDDGSPETHACWHEYRDYKVTWDGRHYRDPIIALCPVIDGGKTYEGCVNVPADRFKAP